MTGIAARIVVFAGFALFGLRGVLPQYAFLTVSLCLAFGAVGEYVYEACSSPAGCAIGELARRRGWITDNIITMILEHQRDQGGRFGEIAVRNNYLTSTQIEKLLMAQHS